MSGLTSSCAQTEITIDKNDNSQIGCVERNRVLKLKSISNVTRGSNRRITLRSRIPVMGCVESRVCEADRTRRPEKFRRMFFGMHVRRCTLSDWSRDVIEKKRPQYETTNKVFFHEHRTSCITNRRWRWPNSTDKADVWEALERTYHS